ncbi:MAG TPA: FmdB family zinc ribbon protein [Bryobacteraceae bacterium]|nr:FmdB family zinc ribbon protein [Bryobacteraceae bacterium]
MPLYEYKCHRCNKIFEVRQKFSDEPLTVHEECGGETERLISVPSFQFKGTGWYVTDYGRGGSKPSGSNGSNGKSESKSESTSGDSSKSDSGKSEPAKSDSSSTKSESSTKVESKPSS